MKDIIGFSVLKILRFSTKFSVLVLFISAILFQTSAAIPVTRSGQRLILHTAQYREYHHQQSLQQKRTEPPTVHHPQHHHVNLRSLRNMAETAVINNNNNNDNNNNNHNNNYNNNNNNNNNVAFCRNVKNALKMAKEQVKKSLDTLLALLNEYIAEKYKDKTHKVDAQWDRHNLLLVYPHAQHDIPIIFTRNKENPEEYVLAQPNENRFKHIVNNQLTEKMIAKELQDVHISLEILRLVIEEVKTVTVHQAGNLPVVDKYFDQAINHIKLDLQSVDDALTALEIPIPVVGETVVYDDKAQLLDWLVIREHISFLQYLSVLYDKLLNKCDT